MTFLDAYALVALVAEEPAAAEVEHLLRAGESRVVISNLAEAIDVSQRVHGFAPEEVRAALEPLMLGGVLSTVVSDEGEGWLSAELRAKHYDRRASALSLADCLLLAHVLGSGDRIATSDPALAAAARTEGVDVVALPDSAGARP